VTGSAIPWPSPGISVMDLTVSGEISKNLDHILADISHEFVEIIEVFNPFFLEYFFKFVAVKQHVTSLILFYF
jgi:hypothetical protein